jgi:hypothetical protein
MQPHVESSQAIDGWLRDLDALCASIRLGLAPLLAAKLATVVDRSFSVREATFGTYTAAGLEISLVGTGEARVALVRPWGLSILGAVEAGVARALTACGRVDVECGVARAILLRFDNRESVRWVAFSGGDARTLDEKLLLELLSEVTELEIHSLLRARRP